MRIEIETSALADPAAFRHIDALVDRLHLHDIAVDEIALIESRWAEVRADEPHLADLQAYLGGIPAEGDGEGPALHRSVMTVSDEATAEQARKSAYSPLILLIEDYEADGRFLEVVIDELGGSLRDLWNECRAAVPAGVRFASASLGNMPIRIRRHAEDAHREGRALRLLVIHDSDRRWPGDTVSDKQIQNVAEACTLHGTTPPHCLAKRAVENYIPDSTFAAMRDETRNPKKKRSLAAFLALPSVARDHFPMKGDKGLSDEERTSGLYVGVDLTPLAGGHLLFPKKPRPMALLLDVDDRRDTFTAEALRARDGVGELDALLQRIADAL